MREGKFDWERVNWTRSRNYIFLEIEVEVYLAPLEGAAWSWHAAHVARHHPAVVAAAREHRALVPGGIVTTMRRRTSCMKSLTCEHFPWSCHPCQSEERPCHQPTSLVWCSTWGEDDLHLIYIDGSGDFIWTWEALDIFYFGAPGLWVLPDFGALVPDDQFVGVFPAKSITVRRK